MTKPKHPSYFNDKGQIVRADVSSLTSITYKTYVPSGKQDSRPVTRTNDAEVTALKKRIAELEELLKNMPKGSGSFKDISLEDILAMQKEEISDTEDKRELFKAILKDNLKLSEKE
jgi:hypothetical protein